MMKLYRLNTGSCGGCDAELAAVVGLQRDMAWTNDPFEADALLLTGPMTSAARATFQALWRELHGQVPLLAIGRCAIDGHPFGRGGLAELPGVVAQIKLDGCPPEPQAIADAIRTALRPARGAGPR